MGLGDWLRKNTEETTEPPPRTVLAAAVPLAGPGVSRLNRMRGGLDTEAWQKDAWYFYDVIGELRSPVNRIALAMSKAEPYAAVVDPDTGEPAGRSEDPRAQAAARMVLGGAKQRSQLLQTYGVIWQISGDAYVIIQPQRGTAGGAETDRWYVLTSSRVTERGGRWTFMDPLTLDAAVLEQNVDAMIRVWAPHPEDQVKADSAVRAAIPVLSEMERATQNIAARLESRVASNGVYWLPSEADFPQGDHPTVADAWSAHFASHMERGISNPGTAGGRAPIIGLIPSDLIASIRYDDIASQMDATVLELRSQDTERLAVALDMPKSVAQGTEADANHWSAWQVDETTYKVFIAPLLERLSDPLTEFWFRPTLIAMGMDPEEADRTILAWDTTGIVVRPDQTEDMKWAWENELISDEVMRNALGLTEEDAPDEDELHRRFLERVVLASPNLIETPWIGEELGFDATAPAPATSAQPPALPQAQQPAGAQAEPTSATPQTQDNVPAGLTAAAEVIVRQSLARAGSRLLTRENRGQFANVPKEELYRHIRPENPASLVSVEFAEGLDEVLGKRPGWVRGSLAAYVETLLTTGDEYDREQLRVWLT